MYDDLHQLLRDILSKYVKPEMLQKCKNANILCDLNFSDDKNHLRNKEADIGMDWQIENRWNYEALKWCVYHWLFEISWISDKFVENSHLKYAVLRNAKSLNPEIMCMTPEKSKTLFKSLVDNLVQLDQVTPKEADGIYAEYKRYLEMVVKKNQQLLLKFN